MKKGLRRESNPGHPHPKRVFYHLTTKPSCYTTFLLAVLPTYQLIRLYLPPSFITTYPPFKKGGFGGNRTRATCTLSRYFTT